MYVRPSGNRRIFSRTPATHQRMSLFYPVVFLHGGPTFYGYMHTLKPFFTPHPIIDFPQPGTKENPVINADLNHHFDEILSQMEAYPDQRVGIVGHSWGANLACLFASRFPERVQFVIAIGTAPFTASIEHRMQHNIHARLSPKDRKQLSEIDAKIHVCVQEGRDDDISTLFHEKSKITQRTYVTKNNKLIPKFGFSISGFHQSKEAL